MSKRKTKGAFPRTGFYSVRLKRLDTGDYSVNMRYNMNLEPVGHLCFIRDCLKQLAHVARNLHGDDDLEMRMLELADILKTSSIPWKTKQVLASGQCNERNVR